MKIEAIVISCYRFDLQLTRLCVASIRFWYPQIPVWLLKDRHYGDFNTREIEKHWDVQIYPGRRKNLGWGFGKLELITELPRKRLLLLDSDTVFTGRVIEWLEGFDEDLIVDKEDFDAAAIEVQFFSLSKLRKLDNQFEFPGYGFNTGQIVATTGCLTKQDFDGLLDWQTRTIKHPEVFKKGEQGLFNYAVLRKVQQGKLTIRRVPLMVWPGDAARAAHIQLKELGPNGPHRQVIHWAGLGWGKRLGDMPRSEILFHFEKMYYNRIPLGTWLCRFRRTRNWMEGKVVTPLRIAAKRVLFRSTQ